MANGKMSRSQLYNVQCNDVIITRTPWQEKTVI